MLVDWHAEGPRALRVEPTSGDAGSEGVRLSRGPDVAFAMAKLAEPASLASAVEANPISVKLAYPTVLVFGAARYADTVKADGAADLPRRAVAVVVAGPDGPAGWLWPLWAGVPASESAVDLVLRPTRVGRRAIGIGSARASTVPIDRLRCPRQLGTLTERRLGAVRYDLDLDPNDDVDLDLELGLRGVCLRGVRVLRQDLDRGWAGVPRAGSKGHRQGGGANAIRSAHGSLHGLGRGRGAQTALPRPSFRSAQSMNGGELSVNSGVRA